MDLNAISANQIRYPDTQGLIYVDAYIGKTGGLFPRKAYIPGLSRSMLSLIEGKFIKDIGIPIIYRVVSMYYLDGIGVDQPAGQHTAEQDQFAVMINEVGGIRTSRLYPWHQKALERIAHPGMGGDYTVHAELGWYRPRTSRSAPTRTRRSRPDGLNALASEVRVEVSDELAVIVAEQEATLAAERPEQHPTPRIQQDGRTTPPVLTHLEPS